MKTVSREWLEFMREQYPKDSRVTLREMKDPYAPVEPGSTGKLDFIDDAGTFHVSWDSGRTLGLIIGEDSFSIKPPETHLLKLYMPMTVDCYEKKEWGDTENEPTELDSREAVRYTDNIVAALARECLPEEASRGLMHYYGGNDSVSQKVKSLTFTAEARDGRLWGVAECQVTGELKSKDLATLKEYISGQASDGFGEGFEQREIKVDGRGLYAHLWSDADSWSIRTEQECFYCKAQETLPRNESEPQTGGMTMQ